MFNKCVFVIASLALSQSVLAQPNELRTADPVRVDTPSGQAVVHEIVSAHPEEVRRFTVHLPNGYDLLEYRRYPVLYLLDGQSAEAYVPSVMGIFATRDRAPEFLVVSLPSRGTRNRDYTPAAAGSDGVTSGGADQFLDYLEKELIPFIDANYRTEPFRILSGESRGGLLALHGLITRPDLFNAWFIFSPALWHSDQAIIARLEQFLRTRPQLRGSAYMNMGQEVDIFETAFHAAKTLFEDYPPEGLDLTIEVLPRDHHGLTSIIGHHIAFRNLFADWRTPFDVVQTEGAPGVQEHFVRLSERLGYVISPPEDSLNAYGYTFLNRKEMDVALALFRLSVELYPQSPNAHDSLAEGLEAVGDLTEAIAMARRAVALATPTNHPQLQSFRATLERLQTADGKK